MTDPASITLADLEADPHPILAEFREVGAVTFVPSIYMWLVTRWDEVVYVCENPGLFSASTDPSWLRQCLGENMLTLDGDVELYGFEFRGPVSLPVAWTDQ